MELVFLEYDSCSLCSQTFSPASDEAKALRSPVGAHILGMSVCMKYPPQKMTVITPSRWVLVELSWSYLELIAERCAGPEEPFVRQALSKTT